jgi:hypothetical protein
MSAEPIKWSPDMTDTVTVFKASSTFNNYGARSISASGTTFACRVVSGVTIKRDEQGSQVVEPGTLYIMSDANIDVGDRLDLPGTGVADPRILEIDKVTFRNAGAVSVHHTKVRFGSM